jgi:hypothetical protein
LELGSEKTLDEFLAKPVRVFDGVRRVLHGRARRRLSRHEFGADRAERGICRKTAQKSFTKTSFVASS